MTFRARTRSNYNFGDESRADSPKTNSIFGGIFEGNNKQLLEGGDDDASSWSWLRWFMIITFYILLFVGFTFLYGVMFDEESLQTRYTEELNLLLEEYEKEEKWLQDESKKEIEAIQAKYDKDMKDEEQNFTDAHESMEKDLKHARDQQGYGMRQARYLEGAVARKQGEARSMDAGIERAYTNATTDIRKAQRELDECQARIQQLQQELGYEMPLNHVPGAPVAGQAFNPSSPTMKAPQAPPAYRAPQATYGAPPTAPQAAYGAPPQPNYGQPPAYQQPYRQTPPANQYQ